MAWMNTCSGCKGWKSGQKVLCDECSGANTRRSYVQQTANLAVGLHMAALEEMRVRAAVRRVEQSLRLWGLP
jgi:DnaJ-class molecular chaperone